MGLLSFLFRAVRGQRGTAAPAQVPQATPTMRLMSPAQRQQALERITPEELKYGEWRGGHSSWIAALRYNPIAVYGQMRVKKGGKVYTFARMTFAEFKAWIDASSWGKHFNYR